jgi:hypothetical protein
MDAILKGSYYRERGGGVDQNDGKNEITSPAKFKQYPSKKETVLETFHNPLLPYHLAPIYCIGGAKIKKI